MFNIIIFTFLGTTLSYGLLGYLIYKHLASQQGIGILIKALKKKETFETEIRDNILLLKYEAGGRRYVIPLPYSRKDRMSDINRTITVEYHDGSSELMNHPPGVSPVVNIDHLNAKDIKITRH